MLRKRCTSCTPGLRVESCRCRTWAGCGCSRGSGGLAGAGRRFGSHRGTRVLPVQGFVSRRPWTNIQTWALQGSILLVARGLLSCLRCRWVSVDGGEDCHLNGLTPAAGAVLPPDGPACSLREKLAYAAHLYDQGLPISEFVQASASPAPIPPVTCRPGPAIDEDRREPVEHLRGRLHGVR